MPLVTTRGFTNHEQFDTVGLVHMNGRVYDPELGRFLSADIVVQDVTNLQAWNAYSYVLNNPLSMTDPTGFFFKAIFKAIGNFFKAIFRAVGSVLKAIAKIPIISAIVKIVSCAPHALVMATCTAASIGLTLGAGGSIGDALISAALSIVQLPVDVGGFGLWDTVKAALSNVQSALFYVVKPIVHGAIGGAMSVIQGGEFLAGFASTAAGAIGGMVGLAAFPIGKTPYATGFIGRTAIASIAGGVGSRLSGGKFANGAVTAAFAHMYNAEEHLRRRVMKVIDNTRDAWDHYKNGKGETVKLGPDTRMALRTHPEQQRRLERITSGRTSSSSGNYGVDLTGRVFHVGDTRVDYTSSCFGGTCKAIFTGFSGDGFWDVNVAVPWAHDGIGRGGELPGGTPYRYEPYVWVKTYPDPNQ